MQRMIDRVKIFSIINKKTSDVGTGFQDSKPLCGSMKPKQLQWTQSAY